MEMRKFKGIDKAISLLGFGLMRLPLLSQKQVGNQAGDIDYDLGLNMVARAIDAGVNYFDTAWMYHAGESEVFAGKALSRYPRDKFNLATKMPAWLIESAGDLERIFSEQLKKCGVDYFDFYLMHDIGGKTYNMAIEYDVYEFLRKKKDEGRIKYIGFSLHDKADLLTEAVTKWDWDFVQIQINYIDWDTLDSKRQYEILAERGIPVIVMEPVRGGALSNLSGEAADILTRADANASQASWAIRYAASLPGVLTVLSGMTTMEQLEDNIKTLSDFQPISDEERSILDSVATEFRALEMIPCTSCRYCMDCPAGVDIPRVFGIYNYYMTINAVNTAQAPISFRNRYRTLTESQQAHNCTECGKCVDRCPQGIDIPKSMNEIADTAAAVLSKV